MPTINEMIRLFGDSYLNRYSQKILPSHLQALDSLAKCRTEAMGSHEQLCKNCGYEHRIFHSCKNRSCPQCFFKRTEAWLRVQEQRLLPVHHFHLVFTLPSQLREIIRRHQKALYPVLFHAAKESLQALASDERYVGGKLGITSVLHTWSGAMIYHPHIHCLVPGIGIATNGEVQLTRKKFLVPVRALSAMFRGRFLALARKAVPDEDFSVGGDIKKWVVFSKPVKTQNTEKVLRYLGRYLHRIAISNSSILKLEPERITFRYKKSTDVQGRSSWGIMKLESMEFLRRFLQHVLPKGMAKVRYYGWMSASNKDHLEQVRSALLLKAVSTQKQSLLPQITKQPTVFLNPCPECGSKEWKTPWDFPIIPKKPP